jgi:hypothetical protein
MTACFRFLTDCFGTLMASAVQYRRCSSGADPAMAAGVVMDQIDTRLVRLELQDRQCLSDARRHRASGAKGLFRARMLEHRRVQSQMAQLQRFRETAMAQFDALSNHELNQTFVRAMQGLVGGSKDKVAAVSKDAESVMEDFHESVSQVKDLSDFLGQPMASSGIMAQDEVTDEELDAELNAQFQTGVLVDSDADSPMLVATEAVPPLPSTGPMRLADRAGGGGKWGAVPTMMIATPSAPAVALPSSGGGIERMLVLPAMLNSR